MRGSVYHSAFDYLFNQKKKKTFLVCEHFSILYNNRGRKNNYTPLLYNEIITMIVSFSYRRGT